MDYKTGVSCAQRGFEYLCAESVSTVYTTTAGNGSTESRSYFVTVVSEGIADFENLHQQLGGRFEKPWVD
jgi:hypothetical protein